MNIRCLKEVESRLRNKGFIKEADRLAHTTQQLEGFIVEEGRALDDILNAYQKIHKIQGATKHKVVTAVIRKENECPFGLPIPQACKFAGDSVQDMDEGPQKINKMIYNTERDGTCCIYNDGLMESHNSVNCTYGTVLQGKKSMKVFRGNPQYPKMWSGFSGIALDRGYHAYSQQYGNELFPYPSIYG